MKRSTVIVLVISLLASLLLLAYFFYKSYGIDAITRFGVQFDFASALKEIKSDCMEEDLTPQFGYTPGSFKGNFSDLNYIRTLAKAIDSSITYDPNKNMFISPTGTQIYIEAINKNDKTFASGLPITQLNQQSVRGHHCWVIWMENSSGVGTLAYRTVSGKSKKISVRGFLYIMGGPN